VKDFAHKALHNEQLDIPIVDSKVEPWDRNIPLLSVVVPCYNYGRYIRAALKSIRSQTFQDYEIIVVDDGSTDPLTLSVLKDLESEGIKIMRQEHAGPAPALNRGISAVSGKYVCCLSADDTIESTYLEKCLALLESNPGVSFAYSLVKTFGHERTIGVTKPFDLRLLLVYNHVCGSAVFHRAAWQEVGGFDSSMPAYEDWDFWIRLGKHGLRGKLIPEPLFNWRRHPQTFGRRVDQNRLNLIAQIKENHAKLFSDPAKINEIQEEYRDYRVVNPFLNMSSRNQYSQNKTRAILFIGAQPMETSRILGRITGKQVTPIIVTTSSLGPISEPVRTFEKALSTYCLPAFLSKYYWRDFVINLIKTRAIQSILISETEVEWAHDIKAETSDAILDVEKNA
jgi:glycosyltransferase involved in cell wall biosynthesis